MGIAASGHDDRGLIHAPAVDRLHLRLYEAREVRERYEIEAHHLGDERTASRLIEKYRRTKCLDTGIFGTMYLIRTLFALGEADLAFTLLTTRTDASFARMMEAGATTLWETWNGGASHDHPMFGAVAALLFTEILGIRQKEGTAGFSDVQIQPADISALDWACGSICTPAGEIRVSVKRDQNGKRTVEYTIDRNQ